MSDEPRIVQLVPAQAGLYAQMVGEWRVDGLDPNVRRRDEWYELVHVFALVEFEDGQQDLWAAQVAPGNGGPYWLHDALYLTTEPREGPVFEAVPRRRAA